MPRVASIHLIADKAHSRKPLFTLSDAYALGPGLCDFCSRPLILCRHSACNSLIGPGRAVCNRLPQSPANWRKRISDNMNSRKLTGAEGIQKREPGCRSPGPLYSLLELTPYSSSGVFLVVDIYVVSVGVLLEVTNQLGVLGAATGSTKRRWRESLYDRTSLAGGAHMDMGRRSRFYAFGGKHVANRIWGNHDDGSASAAIRVAWSGRFFCPT
jgi:hypothetical protein